MDSSAPPSAKIASKHVLLVDDYLDALEVWTFFLEASGYTVCTASTGQAALQQADARPPDAIVLDLQLPDLPGLEVGRRLRMQASTARSTLIALTGRALTQELEEQLRDVFDAVLIKPCEPAELVARIEAQSNPRRGGAGGPVVS
jgi:two-component system cell cycle response regulator DivK